MKDREEEEGEVHRSVGIENGRRKKRKRERKDKGEKERKVRKGMKGEGRERERGKT